MPESHVCPPWWARWAGWWEHQQLFLEAADPEGRFEYDAKGHRAAWRGHLRAAGRTWELIVRWGPGTPYMAPAIEPVSCWSMFHQLRDRSMCLLRPEKLALGYAGVPDMGFWLKRAISWFEGYIQGWAVTPEIWHLMAFRLPAAGYRAELPPMRLMGLPPAWRLESFERVGQFRALVSKNDGLSAVREWRPGVKGHWKRWDEAESLVNEQREELQGIWVWPDIRNVSRLTKQNLFEDERLRKQHLRLLKQVSERAHRKERRFLLAVGSDFINEREPTWIVHVLEPEPALESGPTTIQELGPNATNEDVNRLLKKAVKSAFRDVRQFLEMLLPWSGIVLDTRTLDARRRSGRADNIHRRISSAQVLLVGLGALGSEVAHLLAQEGVGQFLLVDGDLLMPGNVARHRANLTDAGRSKVSAVGNDIRRINPSAKVQAIETWVDEQLPKMSWAPQESNAPFVAVGLTGDEASEHVLGELVSSLRQHCIHAWMEMDGQVLRLFRVLSGKDPTLLELGRDPQSTIPPLPRSSGFAVRPQECAETVLPGSAGNIHAAANFIARGVLDVIVGRQEDENHWLFAPDGVRDAEELVPNQLRSRYGVAGFQLSGAR